ncbi:RagB/SusD family nutrient uptake outer membrane protein [Pedobacter sp. R-06]|uniref:RagB/SusD family nutrient uptake outer membrane protein n=1 Tax=Pedobacter sp. R-06 TaxID=3404051 RepID=UPI003CF233C4
MIPKYLYIIALSVIVVFVSGCKKYLNIQPEDKYTQEQVFSNELAVQQALNGLYFNLSSGTLYGVNMTNTTLELMAQRYNVSLNSTTVASYQQFQLYTYTDANTLSVYDNIWTSTYSTITKANAFILNLKEAEDRGIISHSNAGLLKGEAIGIRAMLHFDMLRIFGPVYLVSPDAKAIPYYKNADAVKKEVLTAKQVLDSVSADLATAKALLAGDPVINGGVINGSNFYSSHRNQRLNYYAVEALQARVFLYAGKRPEANQAARLVLQQGEKWFPWLPYTSIVNNPSPDRIFSTEVLFGVYNQDMYTNQTALFSPELNNLLTPLPERLTSTFEGNQNDYRYYTTWVDGIKGRTFFKFADLADKTKPWRFIQPLIRKSELYYIIAETETDPSAAINFLNTARFNRGLVNLPPTASLDAEIQKEYQKEFWGEGQLFFYYKRKNRTSIPSAVSPTANISMNTAKYVLPLPLSETSLR